VVGWSFRLSEVIYGGCIPVIIVDDTIPPFGTILDYRLFAIHIPESKFTQIEEILLSYSMDELKFLQANLLAIRNAFVYGLDGTIDDPYSNNNINPMAFILTGLYERNLIKFPISN